MHTDVMNYLLKHLLNEPDVRKHPSNHGKTNNDPDVSMLRHVF